MIRIADSGVRAAQDTNMIVPRTQHESCEQEGRMLHRFNIGVFWL